MVAGATGIALFLLVLDASEGARPQTHEHLAILRLLGVTRGVVAVTKSDAVDPVTLEHALTEARELVPEAHAVLGVSARTGHGLDELRAALAAVADAVEPPRSGGPTRLYVDRVFALRGIGTVATGTLWSGTIRVGDQLRAEPAGLEVRVRSVQVHDRTVDRAEAGQRVAVALPGADRRELARGAALVEPGHFPVSYRLDVTLEELEPIAHGARVLVHHGTSEVPARVARAEPGPYAQLRLAEPLVAARGDRLIVRAETTLGGARILDPAPERRLDRSRFELLDVGDARSIVGAVVREPVTRAALEARGLLLGEELETGLAPLVQAGPWYLPAGWLEELRARVHRRLEIRASEVPHDPGLPLGELFPVRAWAADVQPLLGLKRADGKAYLPGIVATLANRADDAAALEAELGASRFDAVKVDDRELAAYLERAGRLVRLGDGLAIGCAAYASARDALVSECREAGSIRLARFRDLLGSSRRTAQLLLERFDADGLTRRVGDERVLRRSAGRR